MRACSRSKTDRPNAYRVMAPRILQVRDVRAVGVEGEPVRVIDDQAGDVRSGHVVDPSSGDCRAPMSAVVGRQVEHMEEGRLYSLVTCPHVLWASIES